MIVLSVLSLGVQAQTFDFKGNVNTREYDGLIIYLCRNDVVDRDKSEVVDSCKIVDGCYHFIVSAPDSACWGTVVLPPKNRYFAYGLPELNVILEPGKVEANCHGYSQELKGGTINQQYEDLFLRYDRLLRVKVDSMMKRRESVEKNRPYTDAENEAYLKQLADLYQGNRKYLNNFIAANISNQVGAHLFLTYRKDYFPAGFYQEMKSKVNPVYLQRAEARDRTLIETQQQALKARRETKVGNHYKDFPSRTPEGQNVRFSDYVEKGKVTLLDFWASWCGPCIQESKELKNLYATYHDKGFNVVSVSLDTNKQKWLDAIKKHELPWAHLSSLKGFKDDGALAYAVQAIPYIVLIDREGNIVLQNMHGVVLHDKIKEMFK
mgnify:CR=1 FL=1